MEGAILDSAADARTAVLVLCGLFFLPHTVAKLRNIDRASEFFARAGLRPPRVFVVLTAAMETVAAVGMVSGIYPQAGALIAATVLFVAAWAQGKVHGWNWRWQLGGSEYMLFWGLTCLTAAFLP